MRFVRHLFIVLSSLLLLTVLLAPAPPARGGTGTAVAATEAPAPQKSSAVAENDRETPAQKKIDLAGEKIGDKIDGFTERAASRLGKWVDAELFAGITWLKLLISLLLLFVVAIIERVARAFVDRHLKKAPEAILEFSVKDHLVDSVGKPMSLFIWAYGIYAAATPLLVHFRRADGTNLVHEIAQRGADLGGAIALFWFIYRLVSVVDARLRKWAAGTDNSIDDMLAPLLGKTLRVFIVIIGAVLILQNLTGVEIGPLLASLGVGGIAIALAAKDSIANFFGTLTILFDKPFQVGQRIVLENTDGVVESVGFRSTRIRTLTGNLVTIPNEKLVNTAIENVGKRPHIRWLSNLTITYDTPPEKVETAVAILGEILDNHEGMHPDFPPRVYFNGFNDWSLNILMIAWYHPPDYWAMQAWQQKTCLEILRRFNAEGIDFAFPSQTVYLANDDTRQLKLQMLKGDVKTYTPE